MNPRLYAIYNYKHSSNCKYRKIRAMHKSRMISSAWKQSCVSNFQWLIFYWYPDSMVTSLRGICFLYCEWSTEILYHIVKRIFKRLEANLSFVIRYLMLLPILTPSYYLSVTISTRCLVHFSVSSNISAMRQRTLFDLILLVQLDRAQVVCPVHKPSHSFALTSVCRP